MAIKKEEPKIESEKLKEASQYSHACKLVKYSPRKMVIKKAIFVFELLLFISEWWAQVTVIPEESKISVLSKGIWKGFIAIIPIGGQILPISIFGERLLWKNIQKKETKKSTSEEIKSNIPIRSPSITLILWYPWKELSREMSRHHKKDTNDVKVMLK